MKIIIAGGRGFIGSRLATFFAKHRPLCLSRHTPPLWNPEKRQIDKKILEDADVIINLAGEGIAGRWTEKKKEAIAQSRYTSASFLTDLMQDFPPKLYIGASAIGYYGKTSPEILTEASPPGEGFLAQLCQTVETLPEKVRGVRKVYARFGLILSPEGGVLQKMLPLYLWGLGAKIGTGQQRISWMALDDVCAAILHVIENKQLTGPVNFVAPEVVTQEEWNKALGRQLRRPTPWRIPEGLLKTFLGEGAEVMTADLAVAPRKLEESRFAFRYPHLEEAFAAFL